MGAKEEVVDLEPVEDAVVTLEIPYGHGAADAEEHTDDFGAFVGVTRSILEAAKVLLEVISGRGDVAFHREGASRGGFVDGEDHGGWSSFLEFKEDIADQGLDGKGGGVVGKAVDVDPDFLVEHGGRVIAEREGVQGWRGRSARRWLGVGRVAGGAAMVRDVHVGDRRAEGRRD